MKNGSELDDPAAWSPVAKNAYGNVGGDVDVAIVSVKQSRAFIAQQKLLY